MKLAIGVMHASFDEERRRTLPVLLGALGLTKTEIDDLTKPATVAAVCRPDEVYFVWQDADRKGAWWTASECWREGATWGADWIVLLNDDALPCDGFIDAVRAALSTRDPRDPVCFYTWDRRAVDVPTPWYTTHDGLVGVACALSRSAAREFLLWQEKNLIEDATDDGRINLWAMATRRLVYTTVPSLVGHQLPASSLVGNTSHEGRVPSAPPHEGIKDIDWAGGVTHLGKQYVGNHWELIFKTRPESWDVEASYLVERNGAPVSETPHVFIATPAYQPPELGYLHSLERTRLDLAENGILCTTWMTSGDSLVTRGRHCLVHEFLRSSATHLLQWDADLECLDPTTLRKMILTGYDVVGIAYPFRDGSGEVCANFRTEDLKRGTVEIDERGCMPVSEVGTGYLLTSRKVLVDLMQKHPELLYEADIQSSLGAPMWSLFDVALRPMPLKPQRKRYESEDWYFCRLAREAGYSVHVFVPPHFRHWGKKGHEGHILQARGMTQKDAAE